MTNSPLRIYQSTSGRLQAAGTLVSGWESPSNIALIKYWGKKPGQIPANASLSLSLSTAKTITRVTAAAGADHPGILSVNGEAEHPFRHKLDLLLEKLGEEIPMVKTLSLIIETDNSFPHSTGIASSASGISAFILCLLEITGKFLGISPAEDDFFRAASYASRIGSGSACRSVYGGFTVWGAHPAIKGSSDLYAIPAGDVTHTRPEDWCDTILVVSSKPKSLASSLGHHLMAGHPFEQGRYHQAAGNLEALVEAMQQNQFERIAAITECEALSLHGLLMTSHEQGLLLLPGSIEIIHRIRQARKEGLPVFFTIDAGPNIHLLYPSTAKDSVHGFIRERLLEFCENQYYIDDQGGSGPRSLR
ncbi:MAG TPA: hypothetical protein P5531_13555 [Bacteroidales bacterium]|nr:hypothetical protein [Bacteroidales bacterium]HSA44637.1 hypothetical protein [Bacteroidales bacterium]